MARVIIQTDRESVVLKELVLKDAAAYFALLNEDRGHLSQFGDRTSKKYPDEEAVLWSILNQTSADKLRFGIWDHDTFVGTVGLTHISAHTCEIGGWTGKRFCRQGYALVSRSAVVQYARSTLGYKDFCARTHPDNEPSQQMLQKVGFIHHRDGERFRHFILSFED